MKVKTALVVFGLMVAALIVYGFVIQPLILRVVAR